MCRFLVKTYTSKTQRAIDFFYLWVYIIFQLWVYMFIFFLCGYTTEKGGNRHKHFHALCVNFELFHKQATPSYILAVLVRTVSVVSHIQFTLVGFYTINILILRRLLEGPPLTMGKSQSTGENYIIVWRFGYQNQ